MTSIISKLKEGVDQMVSGAQEKIHEAQLRAQLRLIEKEKADQIAALGSALYAMHHIGEIQMETLEPQFQALGATDTRLEVKQKEIAEFVAASGISTGHSDSENGAPASTERHCDCGAVLSPAAKFCPECGKANPVEPV